MPISRRLLPQSEASVTDLSRELDKASSRSRSGPGGSTDTISVVRDLLGSIPFGGDSDSGMSKSEMNRGIDDMERIRAGPAAGGKRPEDMSPQELHAVLWQVLTFRDSGRFIFLESSLSYLTTRSCQED